MPEASSPTRTPPPFTQQPPREAGAMKLRGGRDVECLTGRAEAVGQRAPHCGRGGQHAGAVWEPLAVERKAQGALPQHHPRRPVARVALRFYAADPALVSRGARVDLNHEEPLPYELLLGPCAGIRQHTVENESGRWQGEPSSERGHAPS